MGHWTANLSGWLIGPQTLVDHLPQQIIFRPGQIFDFRDQFGPHPMHATDDEGRAKANRRFSPIAVRPGGSPLTERTAGVRPVRREQVFMPRKRPC